MPENRARLIEAMEEKYTFPGYYPVTLIARSDLKFYAQLHAALEYEQDGNDFEIDEQPSRRNNYISYRIKLFVQSADEALNRKEFLRKLTGVLVML